MYEEPKVSSSAFCYIGKTEGEKKNLTTFQPCGAKLRNFILMLPSNILLLLIFIPACGLESQPHTQVMSYVVCKVYLI